MAGRVRYPYSGDVNRLSLQLAVTVTPHTAAAVRLLRDARAQVPCHGSVCAALDLADPDGIRDPEVYREAVSALDVGARVFGHPAATSIGAHCEDAAFVFDVAVYHLTGAPADTPAALAAFSRAAGPLLESTL